MTGVMLKVSSEFQSVLLLPFPNYTQNSALKEKNQPKTISANVTATYGPWKAWKAKWIY